MSFGSLHESAISKWGLTDLVDKIAAKAVVVTAAGNCDFNFIFWPARLESVLAVGATDDTGSQRWTTGSLGSGQCAILGQLQNVQVDAGSSWGQEVDLAAPASGTSFAAPQVAAMAAILKARSPNLSGATLRAALLD